MSFLKRLFGGSVEDLTKKADAQFERADFGSAKLTYEKARDRAEDEATRAALGARISEARDGIAAQRTELGRGYLDGGDLGLAVMELSCAIEVAASDAIRDDAQELLDSMEQLDAVEQATVIEVSDEERRAMIIGQWDEDQGDELEALGDPLLDGLLLLLDEKTKDGRELLEALLEAADAPVYLFIEVGRARLLDDDVEGAKAAIATFLERVGAEGGEEPRLNAHLTLARICDEASDFDGAMAQLEAAVEAIPHDPRPYLHMGNFLRRNGHGSEAVEVLESALEVTDSERPHWGFLQELGLAQAEAARDEAAVATLEQILTLFTERGLTDFPPEAASVLAELHAKAGRKERAADIFRHLAAGSDREGHGRYHQRTGQLLAELGLEEEAQRMLTRAEALFEDDEEARLSVQGDLEKLG